MSTAFERAAIFDGVESTKIGILNEEVRSQMIGDLRSSSPLSSSSVVLNLPKFEPLQFRPSEFFAAIQEWEGVVTSVREDGFEADLTDLTADADETTEMAEISFEDVDPIDIPKIQPGAVFRWAIGHSRTRSGESSRKWVFYFRPNARGWKTSSIFETVAIPQHVRAAIDTALADID